MAHSKLQIKNHHNGLKLTRPATHGGTHATKPIGHPIMMSQQDNEMLDDEDQAQQLAVAPNAAPQREIRIEHLRAIQVAIR